MSSKEGQIFPKWQDMTRKTRYFRSTIASTIENLGHIDFLVNNGGGQFPLMANKMKTKAWNAVVETNLTGTFLMSREGSTSHTQDC